MYEKDKKKGEKRRKRRLCAGQSGSKEKREISIRISRRREKAYLLVRIYTYFIYILYTYYIFFYYSLYEEYSFIGKIPIHTASIRIRWRKSGGGVAYVLRKSCAQSTDQALQIRLLAIHFYFSGVHNFSV